MSAIFCPGQSHSVCGSSRMACANDVCSWKVVRDTVGRVATCAWCYRCSTCKPCNRTILDSGRLATETGNSNSADGFCDCEAQTCKQGLLGAYYSDTGHCPGKFRTPYLHVCNCTRLLISWVLPVCCQQSVVCQMLSHLFT